jgi:fatty acid desaturase
MSAYSGASLFLLGALLVSITALCLRIRTTKVVGDARFVAYVLYALLLFHVFLPRGIYKYYIAYITPFAAIFTKNMSRVIAFFGLNVLVLVVLRIFTPWILVALLAFPVIRAHTKQRASTHPTSERGKPRKFVSKGGASEQISADGKIQNT